MEIVQTWTSSRLTRNSSGVTVGDGEWHHVAVTYDGSRDIAGIKHYFDGVETAYGFNTDTLGANTATNNEPLRIGRGHGAYFDGDIDDVRVWNLVLTADEILDNLQDCDSSSSSS